MSRKKIVVIGPSYPYRGGIAVVVASLCNSLATEHDVELINFSLLYPSLLFPGKTQFDESESKTVSFPSKRLLNSINPISWYNVAKVIQAAKPDLIMMEWYHPFFALCFRGVYTFLPKKYKGRILITADNVISHEARFVEKALTKIGINIASQYMVFSEVVREDIKAYAKDKKVYKAQLPPFDLFTDNNVQDTRSQFGFSKNDFVLLFFGYIRKYKGLDILLKAMPQIKAAIPNVRLLIVGESYEEWSNYQSIIDECKMNDCITVVSRYVANEEVSAFYYAADAAVLPYRSATNSAILSVAYSFNKPAIANNVGSFPEFVKHKQSGYLVDEVTPEAFAHGVIEWHKIHFTTDYTNAIQELVAANSFGKVHAIVNEVIADLGDN
jgi:glycosyltransferase involved in cell wall biosynthesis